MARKQVRDLATLQQAALDGKAVVVPGTNYSKPCPAAWMINLQGHVILSLFKSGMYIYEKAK